MVSIPEDKLTEFCKRRRISKLYLFGSALTEGFGPSSDIDLLFTLDKGVLWSLFDHGDAQEELREILGRNVDLVNRDAIENSQNEYRREAILQEAREIYSATEETP